MLSSFRRSLRMGPIRVNLSPSGIGVSAGVNGARVSVGPRGTYVSLTPHGFQYRRKLDPERPRTSPPGSGRASSAHLEDGAILTASVSSLQQTSPDDVAAEIQRSSTRGDLFKVYGIGAVVLLLVALVSFEGWAVWLLALLLAGGALPVYRWNAERRTARLLYDVDDPAAMERFALASAVGEALGQSASVCHIYSAVPTRDQRRNAGASTLIQRTPTFAARQAFAPIETNLDPWSIGAGPQQLLFLPDRLLVREGGRLAALPYEHIAAAAAETRFIEEGFLPPDAQQIGTTWRYVCKDGTPDLRFRDNRQLAILRYGEVAITSGHGVRIVFQVSRPEAAFRAAQALNALAELARRPLQGPHGSPAYRAASPASPVPPAAQVPGPPRRSPPVVTPPTPPVAPTSSRPAVQAPTPVSPPVSVRSPSPAAVIPWIPSGCGIVVAGYRLPDGMMYVGEGLPPLSGARDVEPALINPKLPVDRDHPNRSGEGVPYWPSYSTLAPADRAAFLEWLAAGRRDPGAHIGYVFLFLYGLERRLLGDARRAPIAPADRDALHAEVTRLLAVYGDNRSFRGYATELLAAMWMGADAPVHERVEPPVEPHGGELPLLLRLALGQLARDGRPVPAGWARSWVLCDPQASVLTPIRRCPEEFRALFGVRYAEAYGEGLVLKPGGRPLTRAYHPASASFGGEIKLETPGVADPTARTKPLAELHKIADRCAGELDAFSRWIGKHPEQRGSAAAVGLLPAELIALHRGNEVETLLRTVEGYLGAGTMALAPAAELLGGARAKKDIVALAHLLQRKGYGMEPDVRFGGELACADGKVVVFRVPADAPTTASGAYRAAALLVQLAVTIAGADGEVSAPEIQQIEAQLGAMSDLLPAERARLLARTQVLAQDPPGLTGLKKRLDGLDERQRGAISDLVIAMAAADGRIDPGEVKLLVKLFPMLGFEASEVYRRIHALTGARATPAAGPVSVRPAESGRGFTIPAPPVLAEPSGVVLDMALVRSKLAETSAVANLLGAIFTEEPPPVATPDELPQTAPGSARPEVPAAPSVGGLDNRHSTFVRRLAERPSWPRTEVEVLAAALGLLVDGALEVVNEAAFDACGSAVSAGDDPIEIDGDVAKELCA